MVYGDLVLDYLGRPQLAYENARRPRFILQSKSAMGDSGTPTETAESNGEPTSPDPYGAIKVIRWEQTAENLYDFSSDNPYDDARAHRGQIRGDFVVMGYSYTPNWAAARNGNDKYDFYVRRSFDGGVTWTTDPAGDGVEHCHRSRGRGHHSAHPL